MNVFLSADIEGTCGIADWSETERGTPYDYNYFKKQMTREVCAACGIDVANFNSPGQIVISGEKEKLAEAVEELKNRGMRKVIVLNVAGAFHSRLMAPAGEALKPVLEATPMTVPAVPVYHN